MRLLTLYILLFTLIINAESLSNVKAKRLTLKGKKIVELLCDKSKLPKAQGAIDILAQKVIESQACGTLDASKSKAVAFYLLNRNLAKNKKHLEVPDGAKCPVCGMFVYKYPKWAAMMEVNGKKHYFDGVKDMMKYYFFDQDFPYDRRKIESVVVSDYYTLEPLDATKAYYVVGSNIYGPMGNELIPFKSKEEARNFLQEHKGRKILRMSDITPQLVMSLDKEK